MQKKIIKCRQTNNISICFILKKSVGIGRRKKEETTMNPDALAWKERWIKLPSESLSILCIPHPESSNNAAFVYFIEYALFWYLYSGCQICEDYMEDRKEFLKVLSTLTKKMNLFLCNGICCRYHARPCGNPHLSFTLDIDTNMNKIISEEFLCWNIIFYNTDCISHGSSFPWHDDLYFW